MTPEELHNIYRAEAGFWWYSGMRAIAEALLDPLLVAAKPASKGLDAGCGTGFNAWCLERRYGLQMYGVAVTPLAIRYCRERTFLRSAVASVMELPLADGCLDMVIS